MSGSILRCMKIGQQHLNKSDIKIINADNCPLTQNGTLSCNFQYGNRECLAHMSTYARKQKVYNSIGSIIRVILYKVILSRGDYQQQRILKNLSEEPSASDKESNLK